MAATIKIPADEHLRYIAHLRSAIGLLEEIQSKKLVKQLEVLETDIAFLEGLSQVLLKADYDPEDIELYKDAYNNLNLEEDNS